MNRKLLIMLSGVFILMNHPSALHAANRPLLGAQIWIEPGQTPEQIGHWFKTLADKQMPVTRLFMMWNYLEPQSGEWDFSLYDQAFRAAEKYDVKIVATLTAHHGPAHRGFYYQSQGGSIVSSREQMQQAEVYIAKVVGHYKNSPALDTWMLMNEPGQPPSGDPLAVERFRTWLKDKYQTVSALNAAWMTNFASFPEIEYDSRWAGGSFTWPVSFIDWYTFWREHLAWHLDWVAEKIRQSDPVHPIHVNPHALVGNLARLSYDLPKWRGFLSSLGASIHPAWHFGLLEREQFALGVSYVCDLIHGSSEPNPFWVTELQGGNNLYSSTRPLCPTPQDIAQWVWTGVGSGADRVIFWLLNARAQGGEAGEWSLLDFQGRPSERLETAGEIAKVIRQHGDFFANATPIQLPISIILSLEAMTLQERDKKDDYIGRGENAHVQSALAFYQALQELGIPARIKHIHDFDWQAKSLESQLAILPHVSALTPEQAKDIAAFVNNGHAVLITGLTGFYDAGAKCWPLDKYPLEDLMGATLKEVRLVDEKCELSLQNPAINLPVHLWIGEIDNYRAQVIGQQNDWITAIRNKAGKGEAIWIPSMIGLGAWQGDNGPLAELTKTLVAPFRKNLPFKFSSHQPGCLLRVLQNEKAYCTVITNGTLEPKTCRLETPEGLTPTVLWGQSGSISKKGREISLEARETVVILWN